MVLFVLIVGGNLFIEHKIKTSLEENLKEATFSYKALNANILGRSVSLDSMVYREEGVIITTREIQIRGVDILAYLSNKKLEVSHLKIIQPEVVIYTNGQNEKNGDTLKEGNSKNLQLFIKSLRGI